MPPALPHPTPPYKGEESESEPLQGEEEASGEGVTPVREYSGPDPIGLPFALRRRGVFAPSRSAGPAGRRPFLHAEGSGLVIIDLPTATDPPGRRSTRQTKELLLY